MPLSYIYIMSSVKIYNNINMYKFTFVSPIGNIPKDNERVTFKINKDKGIVTCIARVICRNLSDAFGDDCEQYVARRLFKSGTIKHKRYAICGEEFVLIGQAFCDPTDKFDESIGKKIAETRARMQVYKLMGEINKYVEDYSNNIKNMLDKAKEKTNFLYFREVDHCRKLVRETL